MSKFQVEVDGEVLERIAEEGFGFLRVGVDIAKTQPLYTELVLLDVSGDRSPLECVVTGVKDNYDYRFGTDVSFILRVRCTDVDVDDLLEEVTSNLNEAMSVDFAAVDTPDTPIIPSMLTPSDASAGLLKDRDTDSIEAGSLWLWDRRFWSSYGQSSINK